MWSGTYDVGGTCVKVCEAACLCTAKQVAMTSKGDNKGTSLPTAVSNAINALKFDSPFLSVYAALTIAELPAGKIIYIYI